MNNYYQRKYVIGSIIVFVAIIYILRLLQVQIFDDELKLSAYNNSSRHVTNYPGRGLIYDRNGKIMVYNEAAYDLMVIPRQVEDLDTIQFCEILDITKKEFDKYLKKAKSYNYYKPSIFLKQISSKTYAVLQEKFFKYKGFFVQTRTLRKYPDNIAAHVLGYIGEVDTSITNNNKYYKSGDYIGVSGAEKTYEEYLRGVKGNNIYLVDVKNRIKGSYKDGKYDKIATVGRTITTTIDADLQKYAEQLMQNKSGSIVAIEPSTGEILAMVSSPVYDPELLVGRVRSKNYRKLSRDKTKPLFNRALMAAKYPPGSTFKLVNALIGLQEGVITENTNLPCNGGYRVGRFHQHCHHGSSVSFEKSIEGSCNAYYSQVFRKILDNPKYEDVTIGYEAWYNHVKSFGFGSTFGSDFSSELKGSVPSVNYYNRIHKGYKWKSLSIVSLAIGQGELGVTPLQMGNMCATIANRGYYYTPHIVKSIEGEKQIDKKFLTKNFTTIDQKYFEAVVNGMEKVVQSGTATSARVKDLAICGKTGTAENPHGKDHSIFVAFAPKDNPKIAIAVYVENGGYGSKWAAPISSLMIEKYINDTTSRPHVEKRMIEGVVIEKE